MQMTAPSVSIVLAKGPEQCSVKYNLCPTCILHDDLIRNFPLVVLIPAFCFPFSSKFYFPKSFVRPILRANTVIKITDSYIRVFQLSEN